MKTYKLNGLEYYTCASNKKDACEIFWLYKIGVTHNAGPQSLEVEKLYCYYKTLDNILYQ
jgi:hypothetical protein